MAKKRVKLGRAHRDTEEELTQQAIITPQDIEEAKAAARKFGSVRFNQLLDAERKEGE